MIVFSNAGKMDMAAVEIMGLSAKETDQPIGYFGTGLKYAIAIILRHGLKISIHVDGEDYDFTAVEMEFRGQKVRRIHMNGKPLGFTTDLGKNWELWMAYRELYCNTVDEEDPIIGKPPECFSLDTTDRTAVVVEGQAFDELYARHDEFFLSGDPVAVGGLAEAHRGNGKSLFYRSVKVEDNAKPAAFNYNLVSDQSLTEDRTLKYVTMADRCIASLILSSSDKAFIEEVLTRGDGTFEYDIDFHDWGMSPSETFLEVANLLRERNADFKLSPSVLKVCRKYGKNSVLPTSSLPLGEVEAEQLTRAVAFCKTILECDGIGDIIVSDNLGPGVLGRAENQRIYISKLAFQEGTKCVAKTIFEEWMHLKYEVEDHSAEQQHRYLNHIMTLGEKLAGEPL